jgi:hypothetical protein
MRDALEAIWEGRIVGIFEDYLGGRVYELSDGSCWESDGFAEEYHPAASISCIFSKRARSACAEEK